MLRMVSPDSSISPGQRAEKERCQSHLLRIMDVGLATSALFLASPLLVVLCIAGFFDTGSPLFLQKRVGRQQKPFVLVKFRTMRLETMSVATHLAEPEAITPFGNFLRRSKLDELPQLWNVVLGEMSMVGPRPCLFSQQELIACRAARGAFKVRPGITGLAQVQGVDMSTPELLAEKDQQMLETMSMRNYFWYLILTVSGKGSGDRIRPPDSFYEEDQG